MSTWLARLKNQNCPAPHPTKPTKPSPDTHAGGFVGFVGHPQGHLQKSEACKNAPPAKSGADAMATVSRWWLIHYPDRDPVQVSTTGATLEEIMRWNPEAIAAAPFTPARRQPSAPMSAEEETAIQAWLTHIEETDPAIIAEVIDQCQQDADARDYFIQKVKAWRAGHGN